MRDFGILVKSLACYACQAFSIRVSCGLVNLSRSRNPHGWTQGLGGQDLWHASMIPSALPRFLQVEGRQFCIGLLHSHTEDESNIQMEGLQDLQLRPEALFFLLVVLDLE